MNETLRIVQLFSDKSFGKKINQAGLSGDLRYSFQEIDAAVILNAASVINKQTIYLADIEVVNEYFDALLDISLINLVIFIYRDESELYNSSVDSISDNYLRYNFTNTEWLSVLKVSGRMMDSWYGQHTLSFLFGKLERFSSQTLPSIYNSMSDAIYWKDSRGFYVGCNQRFADDFGLNSTHEVIGKCDADLMSERWAIEFSSFDHIVLNQSETVTDIEKEIQISSGRKWLSINKFPIIDSSGRVRGIVGSYKISKDSEKINVKDEKSRYLFKALMNHIPDAIYFKNTESEFIAINSNEANLLGIERADDAIGKTDFDFYDHDFAQQAFADEQQLIFEQSGVVERVESFEIEGKMKWIKSLKVPFFNDEGVVSGVVGISRDVTKHILLENELFREKELLDILMQFLPISIYFKDLSSKYTRINDTQAKILGVNNSSEAISKKAEDFFDEKISKQIILDEKQIFSTGKPVIDRVNQINVEGKDVWFSTSKIPIRNVKGQITGLVGIGYDITNQVVYQKQIKKAFEKEAEANRAKSVFLSHISHEIRTPLNGVIGIGEVLLSTELDEEQKEMVNVILHSGNTLLYMINDLLDLSKIEVQKLDLKNELFELATILSDVKNLLVVQANEKNIQLIIDHDEQIPQSIYGDDVRIKQVIINLVNNAIKFTKAGSVTIKTLLVNRSEEKITIEFKVIDTGVGIPLDKQKQIFNAFTQLNNETDSRGKGVGLGLSICKSLVEKMGGELKLVSTENKGSEFYFIATFGLH